MGLAERCDKLQRVGVPAGSAGSVASSWLHWAPANQPSVEGPEDELAESSPRYVGQSCR